MLFLTLRYLPTHGSFGYQLKFAETTSVGQAHYSIKIQNTENRHTASLKGNSREREESETLWMGLFLDYDLWPGCMQKNVEWQVGMIRHNRTILKRPQSRRAKMLRRCKSLSWSTVGVEPCLPSNSVSRMVHTVTVDRC